MVEICLGLHYLHANEVKLGFFKPENIYVTSDLSVKLANVGKENQLVNNETPDNPMSDVWYVGCILYQIRTLSSPFESSSDSEALQVKPVPRSLNYSTELKNKLAWLLSDE